jgi:2-dehydropantoate 2-reductase
MRVCIFGAGAIGGYLASGLSKVPGVELSLVARGAHLAAIKRNGLKLAFSGTEEVFAVTATDDPRTLGPQDYVIICLKAHQAWEAAEQLAPLLDATTAVVTGQNGVPWWYTYRLAGPYQGMQLESVDPGARQWNAIGPARAIGCVVYPATEIVEPGVVRHVYGKKFGLGEPDGSSSSRSTALSQALAEAGFEAPVLADIRSEIWLKLWGNLCFNPISTLTRATLYVVTTEPALRELCVRMMTEAEKVGRAYGASFRVDVDRRIRGASRVGAHRTSMLQDFESGRALEIDALVAAVREMARIADLETPFIDSVLGLTQQLGKSHKLYPVFQKLVAAVNKEGCGSERAYHAHRVS